MLTIGGAYLVTLGSIEDSTRKPLYLLDRVIDDAMRNLLELGVTFNMCDNMTTVALG